MTGRHITHQQVKLYMKHKENCNSTQESCAAKAGFSTRSARTIDNGAHYTQQPKKQRAYKTRKSVIDEVWANELRPMLEDNPSLQASTLFIHLERTHQDADGNPLYPRSCLRTLQRKVARWLAKHGPSKDIIIPQNHIPGQQALSDFTHMTHINISINGQPFKHMLYHFRLVYSKWSYIKIIQSGESFQALSEGLQGALLSLGGSPKEHRTDSLSAAYKNLNGETVDDLTERYESLCDFYSMQPTRNNKGVSHENGSVESAHGHLKNRIRQELILRGHGDFNSVASYDEWLQNIILSSNNRNSQDFSTEKQALQALPQHKTMDYDLTSTTISKLSMMIVRNMTYSVPSRLAGHTLTLHVYQARIEGYLGDSQVLNIERQYKGKQSTRYVINYKHIIHAFIRKPRAFRFCKYRDEMLPNDNYKKIWRYLDETESRDVAPNIMLRLLKLAADYHCEYDLGESVCGLIDRQAQIDIQVIEQKFNISNPVLCEEDCGQHNLLAYDQHIPAIPVLTGGGHNAAA
jgi:hypothetical protein